MYNVILDIYSKVKAPFKKKLFIRTTSIDVLTGHTKVPMIRNLLWPGRRRMYILLFDFYLT